MAPPRAPLLVACAAVLTALSRGHGHGHGNSQQQKQQFKPFSTSITGLGAPPLGDTPVNAPGVSVMTENSLAHVDQLAVCNDGSPAAYYFAPGSGDGANTWLVYLEGAMFCWVRHELLRRRQRIAAAADGRVLCFAAGPGELRIALPDDALLHVVHG